MKNKITYILYIIALIVVITPIFMEQSGNPLEAAAETAVLLVGLLILIIGKLISAIKRRRSGEGSIFHDVIIMALLIGVAGYIFYQNMM